MHIPNPSIHLKQTNLIPALDAFPLIISLPITLLSSPDTLCYAKRAIIDGHLSLGLVHALPLLSLVF